MKQQLSKGALRARDRFFAALRTMSLRDVNTARLARRIEHEINEALFQIERFVVTHKHASVRSPVASGRIAAKWLELAAECVEIDADLADVVTLFARHWLTCSVLPERGKPWIQRAECVIRLLTVRGEHRDPSATAPLESEQPLVTLVLRGLPRGTQPVDVEVDLGNGAVIGRADDCDWVLPGEVVSRHHAKLRYDAEQRAFFISNLSRNGLGVDQDVTLQTGEVEVSVGTTLRIPKEGHYRILVQSVFVPLSGLALSGVDISEVNFAAVDHEVETSVQATAIDLERDGNDARAAAALLWDDDVRDPAGAVQRIYEQYAFLPPEASALVRDYVYGNGDALALVTAVFADVVTSQR